MLRNTIKTDFMFQLTGDEFANLKYQSGTSSWGGRQTALTALQSRHPAHAVREGAARALAALTQRGETDA